jgi:hypothetical protein
MGAAGLIAAVVGLHAHDPAVSDKKAHRATAAAVHVAGRPDHLIETLGCIHIKSMYNTGSKQLMQISDTGFLVKAGNRLKRPDLCFG